MYTSVSSRYFFLIQSLYLGLKVYTIPWVTILKSFCLLERPGVTTPNRVTKSWTQGRLFGFLHDRPRISPRPHVVFRVISFRTFLGGFLNSVYITNHKKLGPMNTFGRPFEIKTKNCGDWASVTFWKISKESRYN